LFSYWNSANERSLKAALLSSEHFLNVTDFTLDLSASLFGCPTIAQVSISADLARLFFHFPFRFIDSASDFIFRARFHEKESLFMKATDVNFEPASAHGIAEGLTDGGGTVGTSAGRTL
jgi:hypothetical protein